jgi:hypothetical protein
MVWRMYDLITTCTLLIISASMCTFVRTRHPEAFRPTATPFIKSLTWNVLVLSEVSCQKLCLSPKYNMKCGGYAQIGLLPPRHSHRRGHRRRHRRRHRAHRCILMAKKRRDAGGTFFARWITYYNRVCTAGVKKPHGIFYERERIEKINRRSRQTPRLTGTFLRLPSV